MNRLFLPTLIIGCLVLSGCASMSESECQVANWRIIGMEDGSRGLEPSSISRHRQACAKYGIAPNYDQYQLGYEEGVEQFCTNRSGFARGSNGYNYTGICPVGLEDDFLAGYQAGRQLYDLKSEISRINGLINQANSRLKRAQDKANYAEAELVADGKTPEERTVLLQELRDAQNEKGQLENEIRNLEIQASERQGELNVLASQYNF